ncbi:LacI family DNA-binding transcriptional regulator [Streptomyces sp. NPDC001858]
MTRAQLRPPTMADVARLAGVSHQTVSRVLGDHPNVRDETRSRVLRAIEEMGYRRNSSARALATRRTRTLGVVASDTTLYGPASTLFALEEAARAEGYLVSTVSLRELTMEKVSEALDHLSEGGVEGVVAIAPQRSAVEALAELRHPFPVVVVGSGPGVDVPSVSVDQHLGARLATGHLLAAGHRTVWHLAGPEDWQEAADRAAGWRATLEAAEVEPPMLLRGDWSPLSGYRAGQELAGWVGRGLTAVFVANDQMALGVLRALREAGVRTPQDVAVVGFDDIPESEFFAPPLTTVRQDFSTVGRRGIALLLELIEGRPPQAASRSAIEPQLVVRASSFPYAAQSEGVPL